MPTLCSQAESSKYREQKHVKAHRGGEIAKYRKIMRPSEIDLADKSAPGPTHYMC